MTISLVATDENAFWFPSGHDNHSARNLPLSILALISWTIFAQPFQAAPLTSNRYNSTINHKDCPTYFCTGPLADVMFSAYSGVASDRYLLLTQPLPHQTAIA